MKHFKLFEQFVNEAKYQEFDNEEQISQYVQKEYGLNQLEGDTFAFDIERVYVYPMTTKEIESFWKKLNKK